MLRMVVILRSVCPPRRFAAQKRNEDLNLKNHHLKPLCARFAGVPALNLTTARTISITKQKKAAARAAAFFRFSFCDLYSFSKKCATFLPPCSL